MAGWEWWRYWSNRNRAGEFASPAVVNQLCQLRHLSEIHNRSRIEHLKLTRKDSPVKFTGGYWLTYPGCGSEYRSPDPLPPVKTINAGGMESAPEGVLVRLAAETDQLEKEFYLLCNDLKRNLFQLLGTPPHQ